MLPVKQKNEFANFMKNNGTFDRNQIENVWNKFLDSNPIATDKGEAIPEAPLRWSEFLQHNPQLLHGGFHAGQTKTPQGYRMAPMPGQQTPPPAVPQQPPVAPTSQPGMYGRPMERPMRPQ